MPPAISAESGGSTRSTAATTSSPAHRSMTTSSAGAWEEPVHGATVVGADPTLAVQMRILIGGLMGGEHDALATENISPRSSRTSAARCVAARRRSGLGTCAWSTTSARRSSTIRPATGPSAGWPRWWALPSAMCRTFRRVTGQSVHQFRTAVRVLSSFDEIRRGSSAIAQRWGFSSHSHYTAVFTRWFGVTPTQARRHLRRQPPEKWTTGRGGGQRTPRWCRHGPPRAGAGSPHRSRPGPSTTAAHHREVTRLHHRAVSSAR